MLCREPEHRAFEPKNQFRTMMYIAVELVDRTNGSVLWFCDAIPKLYALRGEMTDFNRFESVCVCGNVCMDI